MNSTPTSLSNIFWGTTIQPRVNLFRDEGALVNATPTQIVVWPGGNAGDDFDPLESCLNSTEATVTGCVYVQVPKGTPWYWTVENPNESEFVSWCKSINCSAIVQVPGEIDDPAIAAEIVSYTINTLDFTPRYWEIGNEPELWKYWDIPWANWPSKGTSEITPIQYAWEVVNYTKAMQAVDPGIQLIGIPATGRPNGLYSVNDWMNANIQIVGSNVGRSLAAEAFHEYPANRIKGYRPVYTLQEFYNTLNSAASIQSRITGPGGLQALINSDGAEYCPTCHLQIMVTELGSAISRSGFGEEFGAGYPGALSDAVSITQAMNLNLSNVDLFSAVSLSNNSWFNNDGSTRPVYTLYSQVFTHLGTEVYSVNVTGLNYTVFGTATVAPKDGDRSDLLIVNTNLTVPATFTPQLPDNAGNTPVEVYEWNGTIYTNATGAENARPATPGPVAYYYPDGLPSSFTVSPESLVLFESYPGAAYPVRFTRTGTNVNFTDSSGDSSRWFAEVNGQVYATNSTNFTLLLPNQSLAVSALPVSLPIGTNLTNPFSREVSYARSYAVDGAPLNVSIEFVTQWRIQYHVKPVVGGTISPKPAYWNASEPLSLAAVASPGYLFDRWFGSSDGWSSNSTFATNNTNATIEIEPVDSPIVENATFVPGYPVVFTETGLPPTDAWSAKVNGLQSISRTSRAPDLQFLEANGTWGYNITPPSGYIAHPNAGAVAVGASPVLVDVTFTQVVTPPPEYTVTFVETGLPAEASWTVSTRGVTNSASSSSISFVAPNGTFGYSVLNVPGYRAPQANGSYTVSGMPTTLTMMFQAITPTPTSYPVTWIEAGLPSGTIWSIWVQPNGSRGLNLSSASSAITYSEPNGTHGFRVGFLPSFRPHVGNATGPANASVTVTGGPATLSVVFQETDNHVPTLYTVSWNETGLWNISNPMNPSTPHWAVELWGPAYNLTTVPNIGPKVFPQTGSRVGLPNGSYSYTIPVAYGFVPEPASGTFQVLGGPVNLTLHFARPVPLYVISVRSTGLPNGMLWRIRLSNLTLNSTTDSVALALPSGQYSFDVSDLTGYFPVPSHGTVTVANATVSLMISFEPTQPPPPPSIWAVAPQVLLILGVIVLAGWGMFSLLGFVSRRRSGGNR